jgi:hydroxymethylpyrimidine/phosphomethylpyrimidine kinase
MEITMANDNFRYEFPRVLTIAGSDSGGGAGIQADLKTFSALGCFGMTAITALTAQNTCGVRAIHAVPSPMLRDQIDAVVEDIGVDAVKIGMLNSPESVLIVAAAIDRHRFKHIIFDPVMVATSGAVLIENTAVEVLVRELFPRVTLITPNLDEAALLVGRSINSPADMELAALELLKKGALAVLLKGGHLPGENVIDLLMLSPTEKLWMQAPRIHSPNTHGTGCTLSSAIAAYLALGANLTESVQRAREYVREALQASVFVRTGKGSGPLNHGHSPFPMQLNSLI